MNERRGQKHVIFPCQGNDWGSLNKIRGLRDETGNWVNTKVQMEQVVNSYFQGLFASTKPSEGDIDAVLQSLEHRMTEDAYHLLSQLNYVDQRDKEEWASGT